MTLAVLGKTFGDRRRALFGYGLGIAALVVWLGLLFPVMRESEEFVDFMNNLPAGMLSVMGIEPATFLTAVGFLGAYLYSLFAPLFVLFFVISSAVAEVPGEERDGLMDMLLSAPVSRTRAFAEKAGGVGLGALALVVILSGALLVVNPAFDLGLSVSGVLAAGLALWLLGAAFGAVTLLVGTFTGRSVLAGGVAGSLAFLAWFTHGFSDLYPALESLDRASPFTWYQEPHPLTEGVGAGHLWLAGTAAVLVAVSAILFRYRDIATRRAVIPNLKVIRGPGAKKRRSPRTAWLLTGLFRKTIWDRRRSVWGWGGGLALLTLVMFSAWPALAQDAEALAGLITSLPREVFAMFGMSDPASIVTPAGFISSRTYQAIGPILIIMFVIRGISMSLIKEESAGVLDLALSVPATRRAVVVGKALGVVVSTGLVIVILTVAALVGDAAWQTGLGASNILSAGAGLGLLGLFFGGLAMAIWAIGGSSFPVVRITAVVAMVTFLLNGLGSLADVLEPARVISPFYWYLGDSPPLAKGFEPTYWLLVSGIVITGWIAARRIERRDIGV